MQITQLQATLTCKNYPQNFEILGLEFGNANLVVGHLVNLIDQSGHSVGRPAVVFEGGQLSKILLPDKQHITRPFLK